MAFNNNKLSMSLLDASPKKPPPLQASGISEGDPSRADKPVGSDTKLASSSTGAAAAAAAVAKGAPSKSEGSQEENLQLEQKPPSPSSRVSSSTSKGKRKSGGVAHGEKDSTGDGADVAPAVKTNPDLASRLQAVAKRQESRSKTKSSKRPLSLTQLASDQVPKGETEVERKRRLARVNARRKRARKMFKIDHYTEEFQRLTVQNDALRLENKSFRDSIALVKQSLDRKRAPQEEGGQASMETSPPLNGIPPAVLQALQRSSVPGTIDHPAAAAAAAAAAVVGNSGNAPHAFPVAAHAPVEMSASINDTVTRSNYDSATATIIALLQKQNQVATPAPQPLPQRPPERQDDRQHQLLMLAHLQQRLTQQSSPAVAAPAHEAGTSIPYMDLCLSVLRQQQAQQQASASSTAAPAPSHLNQHVPGFVTVRRMPLLQEQLQPQAQLAHLLQSVAQEQYHPQPQSLVLGNSNTTTSNDGSDSNARQQLAAMLLARHVLQGQPPPRSVWNLGNP